MDKSLSVAELNSIFDAFRHFESSSARLQEKYMALKREVAMLREELRKKEEEIRRSEKMVALGETAAALAHEVRNPLGSIKLFVSLLKEELSGASEPLELVCEIEKGIDSLDRVVSNILGFAKDDASKKAPVLVNSIIKEIIGQFGEELKKRKIRIDFMPDGERMILANPESIRQVFRNLIQNSIQAIKEDGLISISTKFLCEPVSKVEIFLEDTGGGIPSHLLGRIFEPFVSGRKEGTGLGLAIVKKIIHQHGGEIEAVNSAKGAIFRVAFPCE
ncbi:MAG: hypothetical protein D6808_04300 [Candidatus Dadabacteria bacterium]|nr:MAG: hypothetical protein D6808_04300 [Candidatus Dadabacteria bacterium]